MKKNEQRVIEVCAHWLGMPKPTRMGTLYATPARVKEIFSFEYDPDWLKSKQGRSLDPLLRLYGGQQYAPEGRGNFGIFLDSSPDRWGRVLMQRREAQEAREQGRPQRPLRESDYLLGVYDGHRMGALRFRTSPEGPFLDNKTELACPPWTSLRELENASLQLEQHDSAKKPEYSKWLRMLVAPGSSLGGARPKASVVDEQGRLWIAKFQSVHDEIDIAAWEEVAYRLAKLSDIAIAPTRVHRFGKRHHTFLTRRFDRTETGERYHFASAMTLLKHSDGDDASKGVSYLELVEFIIKEGAQPEADLEQLWRRIVFFICISNVDDHLRNHGFLLGSNGWILAPAYDMNPVATGDGLRLNVSEDDNSQSLDLALSVIGYFRLKKSHAEKIIKGISTQVQKWRRVADSINISSGEQDRMTRAFRIADAKK